MLGLITDRLAEKATYTAQTAAIGLGAFLCLVVGSIFLTIAGWLFLLTLTTPLTASVILGSLFFGIGLLLFVVISIRSSIRKREKHRRMLQAQAAQQAQLSGGLGGLAGVIAAFINGVNEGRRARF